MGGLLQTLEKLGPARLAAVGGAAVLVLALIIFAATRLTTPTMGLLYANLGPKDSGEIAQKLDAMSVPYQIGPDGTSIMAPADQIPKLRLAMAQDSLPHDGSTGYELFDKPEGLGTTDFVQSITELRSAQGELERTIALINNIDSARVHLVLPKHELFSRETQQPSASILLKLRGAGGIPKEEIAAIQNLVATAVPGLQPYRVSIVDQAGDLLARGTDDPTQSLDVTSDAEDERVAYENRLSGSIEDILGQSLGQDHVRVDVNADMNFDKVITNSDTYDPNGQVVRSTQESNETNMNGGDSASAPQPITVQTDLPDGQQTQGADASGGGANAGKDTRSEETTNYEISHTNTTQTREAGVVKKLSVAVLVDGTYSTDAHGHSVYQARTPAEIDALASLVKSAIGFDASRGDQVQVVNMRFTESDAAAAMEAPLFMGMTRDDLLTLGKDGLAAIVAILAILLVVRPVIGRVLEAMRENAFASEQALLAAGMPTGALAGPMSAGALTGPGRSLPMIESEEEEEDEELMIDISKVEGRVKKSSMKKIGEIVDKHPEEAVSILRSWMYRGQG